MAKTILIVIGASGHGKTIVEAARATQAWADVQICDDAPGMVGTVLLGTIVRNGKAWLSTLEPDDFDVAIGVGDNALRGHMAAWLDQHHLRLRSVIHPAASVSPSARLGDGVFIAAGAVVGTETRIGRGAIVNTAASVDHDCDVGAFVHIGPGAHLCGGVIVGAGSLIGVGSAVAPLVRIGRDCRLGAGAALVRPLADGLTAIGVPARPLPQDAILS